MTSHLIIGFIIGVATTLFVILFIKVRKLEKMRKLLIIFLLTVAGMVANAQVKQLKDAYALNDTLWWVKTTDTLLTEYVVTINDGALKLLKADTLFVHYEFLASKLRLITEVRNKKYIVRNQEKNIWAIKPKGQQIVIL